MRRELVIGSRGSVLALWQANLIAKLLKEIFPSLTVNIKKIKTTGDKILDSPLARIGGKGLFVKEIEVALEKREIDLAVHSMKDVPTEIPKGLTIASVIKREDARDVVISANSVHLKDLPQGAVIGTSSLRRKAQLLNFRPDFKIVDVRGNLDTRLKKMAEGQFEAMVLAAAGLKRMGWLDRATEILPLEIMLPAVGQGTIAVETRDDDKEILELVSQIDDKETRLAVFAERSLMKRLEGGCQVPIGALGQVSDNSLILRAMVASLNGEKLIRGEIRGESEKAEELGISLAEDLLKKGADKILKEVREKFSTGG